MLTRKQRRAATLAVAAIAVLGLQAAQAAGVPGSILIGDGQSTSCAPAGANVDYDVAYSPAIAAYAVTAVHLTGLGECAGSDVTVTVTGAAGAVLTELTGTVDADRVVLAVADPVPAADVAGVSLVLTG